MKRMEIIEIIGIINYGLLWVIVIAIWDIKNEIKKLKKDDQRKNSNADADR